MRTPLLLLAGALAAPVASGQLLVENFDYPAGTALNANNWGTHSGTAGQITVEGAGLTYASTPTYPHQSGGSIVLVSPTKTEDVSRTFAPQSSGSVYTSFLMNASVLPNATGSYFLHLGPATLGSAFRGRLWARADAAGTGFNLGLSTGGNTAIWGTTSFQPNTSYLVVMRYDLVAGELNDAARLYVFPQNAVIAVEPLRAEVTAANDGVADPADIGTVALRQGTSTGPPTGNTGTMALDGLRVDTAWPGLSVAAERPETPTSGLGIAIHGNGGATPVLALRSNEAGTVSIDVFDVLGRRVAVHAVATAPGVPVAVALTDLAAGVYVVRAVRGGDVVSARLVVR